MITASDKVGIVPSICSIVLCTIKESCWLTLGIRTSAKKQTNSPGSSYLNWMQFYPMFWKKEEEGWEIIWER